jgi:hypothetical protein
VRAWSGLVTKILVCVALGGCAAPTSYMGISLAPGAAAGDVQDLARRAQAGDKQAQLDLGIAYEEGRGVEINLNRAERLYRMAAVDSGGVIWVYSPSTGNGDRGRVLPLSIGNSSQGLSLAQDRLASLQLRRSQ